MIVDDVNRIFQKYLADNAEQLVIDFEPLLSRNPNLREQLEKKIETYEKIMGSVGGPPLEDKPTSLVGGEIGGCKIFRVLSQSGTGIVYLGWHERLGCDVVVKVLHPFFAENEVLKESFLRDNRTIARLNHKNIIPLYEVGEEGGSLFVVMKLLDGLPLNLLLQKISGIDRTTLKMVNIESVLGGEVLDQFKTPTEFFCTLMLKTAEAVQYAHDNGVIHRDIKPSNIIIGPDGTPILLDFGLSHDEGVESNRLLDVYSLGVTLYEAVTGALPSEGEGREPIRPRERWSDIPPDLEKIIDTAMTQDPEFRYQTAEAFREDLESFLNYHPIQTRPPSWIQRLVYLARRNIRWVIAACLILGTLTPGTYYFYRWVSKRTAEINQEKVKALFPEVLNSIRSNDYETALKTVEKIYRFYPDTPAIAVWYHGLKAKIDRDFQKFKESISVLEKKYPNDLYVRLAKIVIYREEKDSQKEAQEKQFIFRNLNDEAIWRNVPPYLYSLGVSQSLIFEFLEAALTKYPQNAELKAVMNSFCANYLKEPGKPDYRDQKENLEKRCGK